MGAPSGTGYLPGLEPARSFRSAARGSGTPAAPALEQCRTLLKPRLRRPLLDLFHQLTGLHLHLWWHEQRAPLPQSVFSRLCPQVRQNRGARFQPTCQECLRKCWLPELTNLQSEKRFAGLCGLTNYYACLKVQQQPVVMLLVQQPSPSSRAARQGFSRAISLIQLIVHDLDATLQAGRAAVELESLRKELAAAAIGCDAAGPGKPRTALDWRRRKETLIQRPGARGRRPGADQSSGISLALVPPHTRPLNGNRREQLVQRMLDYIHQNYCPPIQLHDLAVAMNLNASYVSSLFSTTLGVTFHHYLEELRIARAKDFLRDPVKRVSEVAYAVGYPNAKHFRYVFISRLGLPPSVWRQTQAPGPASHVAAEAEVPELETGAA